MTVRAPEGMVHCGWSVLTRDGYESLFLLGAESRAEKYAMDNHTVYEPVFRFARGGGGTYPVAALTRSQQP